MSMRNSWIPKRWVKDSFRVLCCQNNNTTPTRTGVCRCIWLWIRCDKYQKRCCLRPFSSIKTTTVHWPASVSPNTSGGLLYLCATSLLQIPVKRLCLSVGLCSFLLATVSLAHLSGAASAWRRTSEQVLTVFAHLWASVSPVSSPNLTASHGNAGKSAFTCRLLRG